MIEETVEVIAIEEGVLILQAQRKSTCQSCAVQKGCGTSVLAQWLGKKISQFRVENTTDAQIGDSLVVGIPENSLLKGSFIIYLLPLLTMFLCALFADIVLDSELASRDLWVSLSGLAGLLAGLKFSRILLFRFSSESLSPVILRKNIEHVKLVS